MVASRFDRIMYGDRVSSAGSELARHRNLILAIIRTQISILRVQEVLNIYARNQSTFSLMYCTHCYQQCVYSLLDIRWFFRNARFKPKRYGSAGLSILILFRELYLLLDFPLA